jgi:vanillate O-demethylase monooxygenase subunit
MSSYLRNAWYVAAIAGEIGRRLTAARILGEDIVLYRTEQGQPVALEDACPHRKLPLSRGYLKGDAVECGYHGLTFNGAGQCIDGGTQEKIPSRAKVRSYPVRDKWGLVWIWMGPPENARENEIFRIDNFDSPRWHITAGDSMICACNYLWLTDNLLDPSHVAWVHRTSFAGGGTRDTPLEILATPNGVIASRWLKDEPPPPFYAPLVKFKGNADRLQYYEVQYPSTAINKSVFAPAGKGGPNMQIGADTYIMLSYNFLTPIDEDTTRYFWLQHRNTRKSLARTPRVRARHLRRTGQYWKPCTLA